MQTTRITSTLVIAGLTLAALAPGAARADGPQAISTAAQHAGMAAASADLGMAQRHLHHVLNCLVGPGGEGFDAAAGNPCGAAGGAIPQTADAAAKGKLQKVADETRKAIALPDLDATKKAAGEIQALLK